MTKDFIDLVQNVLDHEIVDSNNIPCGQVDDLELSRTEEGELRVTAILVGTRPAFDRLTGFLARFAHKIFGSRTVRVPWNEVLVLSSRVKLNSTAEELGLGKGDRRIGRWIGRITNLK